MDELDNDLGRLFNLRYDTPDGLDPTIAPEAVVALWASDPRAFKRALDDAVTQFANVSIVNGIALAAHVAPDPAFRRAITQSAWRRRADAQLRSLLLDEVIRSGDFHVIDDFVDILREVVRKLRTFRTRPRLFGFHEYVLRVARWQVRDLSNEIAELKSINGQRLGRKELFHAETDYCIEATLQWFTCGITAVTETAQDKNTPRDVRAACLHCLGCTQSESVVSVLESVYWNSTGDENETIAVMCIRALARCAAAAGLEQFIGRVLSREDLHPSSGKYQRQIAAAFHAISCMRHVNPTLIEVALKWTEANQHHVAATAVVALERHGIFDKRLVEALGGTYGAARRLRHLWRSELTSLPLKGR